MFGNSKSVFAVGDVFVLRNPVRTVVVTSLGDDDIGRKAVFLSDSGELSSAYVLTSRREWGSEESCSVFGTIVTAESDSRRRRIGHLSPMTAYSMYVRIVGILQEHADAVGRILSLGGIVPSDAVVPVFENEVGTDAPPGSPPEVCLRRMTASPCLDDWDFSEMALDGRIAELTRVSELTETVRTLRMSLTVCDSVPVRFDGAGRYVADVTRAVRLLGLIQGNCVRVCVSRENR